MVVPMMTPQVEVPPSQYALSLRPYIMAVVILQFLCLPGRFFDLLGGLCFLIVCILGYVVVWGKTPMASRWVICWGMICFMNAIFDTLFGTVRLMGLYHYSNMPGEKNGTSLQNERMATMINELPPWVYWWIVVTLIMTPISEAFGAYFSYKLYKDFTTRDDVGSGGPHGGYYTGQDAEYGGGAGTNPGGYGSFNQNNNGINSAPSPGFTPFQGEGRRLTLD